MRNSLDKMLKRISIFTCKRKYSFIPSFVKVNYKSSFKLISQISKHGKHSAKNGFLSCFLLRRIAFSSSPLMFLPTWIVPFLTSLHLSIPLHSRKGNGLIWSGNFGNINQARWVQLFHMRGQERWAFCLPHAGRLTMLASLLPKICEVKLV